MHTEIYLSWQCLFHNVRNTVTVVAGEVTLSVIRLPLVLRQCKMRGVPEKKFVRNNPDYSKFTYIWDRPEAIFYRPLDNSTLY